MISSDSQALIAATADGAITFFHVPTGQELLSIPEIGVVEHHEFSKVGRQLLCWVHGTKNNEPDEIVILDATSP
jgi:hypothetical protein